MSGWFIKRWRVQLYSKEEKNDADKKSKQLKRRRVRKKVKTRKIERNKSTTTEEKLLKNAMI